MKSIIDLSTNANDPDNCAYLNFTQERLEVTHFTVKFAR